MEAEFPYYFIKPDNNTFQTGPKWPQVPKMAKGYNRTGSRSVRALSQYVDEFPDVDPDLEYFVAENSAKLTDILSQTVVYGGFLISEKFKNILEQLKLPPHRFYKGHVMHKGTLVPYYWIHMILHLHDCIDYPNSLFFKTENYDRNLGYLNISSRDEYDEKRNKIKEEKSEYTLSIWAESITFNSSFDGSLDLFYIGTFENHYYASARLKQEIDKHNITGVSILPALNIKFKNNG